MIGEAGMGKGGGGCDGDDDYLHATGMAERSAQGELGEGLDEMVGGGVCWDRRG